MTILHTKSTECSSYKKDKVGTNKVIEQVGSEEIMIESGKRKIDHMEIREDNARDGSIGRDGSDVKTVEVMSEEEKDVQHIDSKNEELK